MNVAALTSIRQVDEARFQLEASTIRGLTEVAKARKSSSLFVCPLGIISQLQAHVPHTYAHRAGKLGNPFSHLSASLSWPDSLFNQAQWAVESVKHTPSPPPQAQQHFATVSCQLPVTSYALATPPRRLRRNARPFADCPTCYLYYDHSQLLAHCHKFPQVFALRPIRKSDGGGLRGRDFLGRE